MIAGMPMKMMKIYENAYSICSSGIPIFTSSGRHSGSVTASSAAEMMTHSHTHVPIYRRSPG